MVKKFGIRCFGVYGLILTIMLILAGCAANLPTTQSDTVTDTVNEVPATAAPTSETTSETTTMTATADSEAAAVRHPWLK